MAIRELARNQQALAVNKDLYILRTRVVNTAAYLRGPDTFKTNDLDASLQHYNLVLTRLSAFSTGHGRWFATTYPDEAAALTDAIVALTTVISEHNTLRDKPAYNAGGRQTFEEITPGDRALFATALDAVL